MNHLVNETSPYLQMHVNNPVDWYPWGEEALNKAMTENKPILLSIGYTACHWCHVMAHESFEDDATAKIMNTYFINIKVDREERPELDKIYQLSAQLLARQPGGWPLTVFLMPDTKVPFFAGTYFPKFRQGNYPSFREVLEYISEIFKHHQDKLGEQSASFLNVLQELEAQAKLSAPHIDLSPLAQAKINLSAEYDAINGGFGSAPKFPMVASLQLLQLTNSHAMLLHTLKQMYRGGIYDQIGGGFFRYTVDEKWQIPHFEKMLYDNSLLLCIYTEFFSQLQNADDQNLFREVIEGIAHWISNEMQGEEGGYYSSLAADTEGKEGNYYVWSREEIKSILNEDEFELISKYYGLDKQPNFEKKWHFLVHQPIGELPKIKAATAKLYEVRSKRVKPQQDNKIIISWNGLAIKGMALAGLLLNNDNYLDSAERSINFIYNTGVSKQLANLDDYVFLIEGVIFFLQARWHSKFFNFVIELVANLDKFEDKEAGGYFFTAHDHKQLIHRIKQYADDSIPSSNAIVTRILCQLGFLLGDNKLLALAEKSLKNAYPHIKNYPHGYCSFLIALDYFIKPKKIIVVRGTTKSLKAWQKIYTENYCPNCLAFFIPNEEKLVPPLEIKKPQGEIIAYFCQGTQCLPPIINIQDFADELRRN